VPVMIGGMKPELIRRMQIHLARMAANGSSLRNQGAPGVVDAARRYLGSIDLRDLVVGSRAELSQVLDRHTEALVESFPKGAKNWGAARKVLNLFFRDCLYNTYLDRHFGLMKVRYLLEIPLDRYVAIGLRKDELGSDLPRWKAIKRVTRSENARYQDTALQVAEREDVARVDIDMWYWHQDPEGA